eukprot:scaffold143274_cov49-Attheya_sp.AAC.1
MARLLVSRSLRPSHRQLCWLVILLSAILPHLQIAAQSLRNREQRTRKMGESGFFESFEKNNATVEDEGSNSIQNNDVTVEDKGSKNNEYLSKKDEHPALDLELIEALKDVREKEREREKKVNVAESSSTSSTTVVQGSNEDGTKEDGTKEEGKNECIKEDWQWILIKHEIMFVCLVACVVLADVLNNAEYRYEPVPVRTPINREASLPVQNDINAGATSRVV